MSHSVLALLRSSALAEECNGLYYTYLCTLMAALRDPTPQQEQELIYRVGACVRELYPHHVPVELRHDQCGLAVSKLLGALREKNHQEWTLALWNALPYDRLYPILLALSPFSGKFFIPVGSWAKEDVTGAGFPPWMKHLLKSLGLPAGMRHAIFASLESTGEMIVVPCIESGDTVSRLEEPFAQ